MNGKPRIKQHRDKCGRLMCKCFWCDGRNSTSEMRRKAGGDKVGLELIATELRGGG